MKHRLQITCRLTVLILAISVAGCGESSDRPELGEVEGTVMMDNKPLAGASVLFQPKKGRPSQGLTDENGHYELSYRPDVPGAAVGTHVVRISTFREANPDAEDPSLKSGKKEIVPAIYNVKSTLTAEVQPGSNEPINFTLKSGGKIIQPE